MRFSAIVLAAGRSTRMGRNKLLLPWADSVLIRAVVERILGTQPHELVGVLGHEAEAVRAALAGLPCRFVENPEYQEGMGTSIAAGVRAADPAADGFLIVLGDMPRLSGELVSAVLEKSDRSAIVVPRDGDRAGNPVFFGSDFRHDLEDLRGDRGARSVLEAQRARVTYADGPWQAEFDDIDEPADLDVSR